MDVYEKDGKSYAIGFLINAEQNMASLPHPWKIDPANLLRIAKTAIGKPWLPGGPRGSNKKHFRVNASPYDPMGQRRSIKEHFKRAKGIITDVIPNEETGNVSVIVELKPKYIQMIRGHEISPFLSPMIEGIVQDPETWNIIDAEIVHVHSVDNPGYKPSVAQFFGVCEGTHNECKRLLTPLAASGTANQPKSYSYSKSNDNLNMEPGMPQPPAGMPAPPGAAAPPGAEAPGMGGDMEQVKSTIVKIGEDLLRVEDIIDQNTDLTMQVAAAAGVDPGQFQKCKQQEAAGGMGMGEDPTMQQPPPQQPQAAMGQKMGAAAGPADNILNQKILRLEQQLNQTQKQLAARDAKAAIDERKKMAETIAKGQIALGLNNVTKKDYLAIIEKYVTMKHPSNPNQLMDLTLVAAQSQEVLNSLVQTPTAVAEPAAIPAPAAVTPPEATPQTQEEPMTVAAAAGYPYIYKPAAAKPAAKVDYDALEELILP